MAFDGFSGTRGVVRRLQDLGNPLLRSLGERLVTRFGDAPAAAPAAGAPEPAASAVNTAILDAYVRTAPSAQNAVDIFKGEWASRFPASAGCDSNGYASLFEDDRITWAIKELGGVSGANVLELGPLEAGHTYMLQAAGAASITAVEANTRAFMKCLIAKELLQLDRAHFLCGDFSEYLKQLGDKKFDVAIASGVLYHMRDPIELLALLSRVSDRIMLWTHYFDEQAATSNQNMQKRIRAHNAAEFDGFRYTQHRYEYLEALEIQGFCGGSAEYSVWLSREDILGALRHFGYDAPTIAFDDTKHPNGPSFAITATRAR